MEYKKAFAYACRLLSQRGYLTNALRQKLIEKLVAPEVAEQVILECTRLNYLDDARWLENFIDKRHAQHRSKKFIVAALYKKGVSLKQAEALVLQRVGQDNQSESISHLLKTRYKKYNLTDFHQRRKVQSSLLRLGFSWEDIQVMESRLYT